MTLPLRYRDLSPNTLLALDLVDDDRSVVAGCVVPLFDAALRLRSGVQRAALVAGRCGARLAPDRLHFLDDTQRLLGSARRLHQKSAPASAWLDARAQERLRALCESPAAADAAAAASAALRPAASSIVLELPWFGAPTLHAEKAYDVEKVAPRQSNVTAVSAASSAAAESPVWAGMVLEVCDPESERESAAEAKYYKVRVRLWRARPGRT